MVLSTKGALAAPSLGIGMFPPGSPMGGTTGVSLEQGLGLTDISRGRPGRRPGGERSSPPDYYFIIDKINPGPHRGRLVGPLVPSS